MTEDRRALIEILEESDREWARDTVEELREHLSNLCNHYNRVSRKFNGGRLSLFCDECGTHIGDMSTGQVKLPATIDPDGTVRVK